MRVQVLGRKKRSSWFSNTSPSPDFIYKNKRLFSIHCGWAEISSSGVFQYRTTGNTKYTSALLTEVKLYCTESYLTIFGNDYDSIHSLLSDPTKVATFCSDVHSDIVTKNMTGVDIDFESQQSWTAEDFTGFISLITQLGNLLHGSGKKLQYSSDEYLEEELPDNFDFEQLNDLPLDAVSLRLWGRQWGQAAGYPMSPYSIIKRTLNYIQSKARTYKLIPGINSYSYKELIGQNYPSASGTTFYDPTTSDGYSNRKRDHRSGELVWTDDIYNYSGNDGGSMRLKEEYIRSLGYDEIIVWSIRNDCPFM